MDNHQEVTASTGGGWDLEPIPREKKERKTMARITLGLNAGIKPLCSVL